MLYRRNASARSPTPAPWARCLLKRRPVRLAGAVTGIAIAVALLGSLGAFFAASKSHMTRQAAAGVIVDWKRVLFRKSSAERLTPELRERIRSSFDDAARDEEHFPSTIDPRIYHVQLIREHLGDLRGKRVLDVGCGKGRFARIFHEKAG